MESSVEIRRLTGSDGERMRALNAVFAQAFDEHRTYLDAQPDDAYFTRILSKEQVIVLVAIHDTEVIGGLVAYELEKLERARSEVYIYDLAVNESHRRQRIATRLIEHLRAIAHARGAWVVYVQADYGDDPAIALYDGLGVREEVLHFDIPVP